MRATTSNPAARAALTRAAGVSVPSDTEEWVCRSIRIAARYMGAEHGEAFGRRNAVPGEMLVQVTPTHVAALKALAD